ncbi:MAG: bifunctional 2-polyprenyl-6-hydroxyphenol methylase/3-demethylubiquinol 3-O-methyltransferase UbiG [Pseudomonadota bacterium]
MADIAETKASSSSRYTASDPSLYDDHAHQWWDGSKKWVRTLQNMVPGRFKHFDPLVEAHGGWQGKRVLDLGCAGGFMAEALAERGAEVTGIDPAQQAIEAARSHSSSEGHDIQYDVGVGEKLPYEDASFHHIVCVDVLEHVSDLDKVISEVSRVLRPGGLFLFDTINRNILARIAVIHVAEDILRLLPKGTHDPSMFIKPAELKRHFGDHGLKAGKITGLGPAGINGKLDFTFGTLPMTAILYIGHAKKLS